MLHHILEGWKCLFGVQHLSELDDFFSKQHTMPVFVQWSHYCTENVLLRASIAVIRPQFAIWMVHVTMLIVPMATRML